MRDPIVEEVRKHREEHSLKFNGDLSAICEDLRAIQAASEQTVVKLSRVRKLRADLPEGQFRVDDIDELIREGRP